MPSTAKVKTLTKKNMKKIFLLFTFIFSLTANAQYDFLTTNHHGEYNQSIEFNILTRKKRSNSNDRVINNVEIQFSIDNKETWTTLYQIIREGQVGYETEGYDKTVTNGNFYYHIFNKLNDGDDSDGSGANGSLISSAAEENISSINSNADFKYATTIWLVPSKFYNENIHIQVIGTGDNGFQEVSDDIDLFSNYNPNLDGMSLTGTTTLGAIITDYNFRFSEVTQAAPFTIYDDENKRFWRVREADSNGWLAYNDNIENVENPDDLFSYYADWNNPIDNLIFNINPNTQRNKILIYYNQFDFYEAKRYAFQSQPLYVTTDLPYGIGANNTNYTHNTTTNDLTWTNNSYIPDSIRKVAIFRVNSGEVDENFDPYANFDNLITIQSNSANTPQNNGGLYSDDYTIIDFEQDFILNQYKDPYVLPGETYTYYLFNLINEDSGFENLSYSNFGGESSYFAEEFSTSILTVDDLPMPSNLEATYQGNSCNEIKFNWDENSGLTGKYEDNKYKLEVSTIINGVLSTETFLTETSDYTYSISSLAETDSVLIKLYSYAKNTNLDAYVASKDYLEETIEIDRIPDSPEINVQYVNNNQENGIKIEWTNNQAIDNETSFQLIRDGEIIEANLQQVGNTSYFLDNINYLNNCQTYEYKVKISKCSNDSISNAIHYTVNTSVSDLFVSEDATSDPDNIKDLSASKGYYADKVRLTWANNHNSIIEKFEILRKEANSNNYTIIDEVINSIHIYEDEYAEAGSMYSYKIVAYVPCGEETFTIESTPQIGFRMPEGIVSGHIEYEGGNTVEHVKVSVNSTETASSYSVNLENTNAHIRIDDLDNTFENQDFGFSTWLNVNYAPFSKAIVTLYDANNNQKLGIYHRYGACQIQIKYFSNGSLTSLYTPQNSSPFDSENLSTGWYHIACDYDKNQNLFRVFINGEQIWQNTMDIELSDVAKVSIGALISNESDISQHLTAKLDEICLYNTTLPADEIIQIEDVAYYTAYNKYIPKNTDGLIAYYHCDENQESLATLFDISKSDQFNKNDAALYNGATYSDDCPSQLSNYAYTDSNGNYMIESIRYTGSGNNFSLTPMTHSPFYGTPHQFEPSQRVIYIGDGAEINNNQDFTDVSSFTVTGSVYYYDIHDKDEDGIINEASDCPVKEAMLFVDGEPVIKNGQVVMTDSDGAFEVEVPIGEHQLSVDKLNHTFYTGVFPLDGYYNFQEDISGLTFIDNTTILVAGRAVGGLVEGDKKLGMGLSNNNIGTATFKFESQNGKDEIEVSTDVSTGEYITELLPIKYVIKDFYTPSNPSISQYSEFESFDVLGLDIIPTLITEYDTSFAADYTIASIDSSSYHHKQNFIYRALPSIRVLNQDKTDLFSAEDSLMLEETTLYDLDAYGKPIFLQNKLYHAYIKVEERYDNYEGGETVTDLVPVSNGQLSITNLLSMTPSTETIMLSEEDGDTLYSFRAATPNLQVDLNNEEYSFTKIWEINFETGPYNVTWQPNDDNYRGIIFGAKPDGTNFITEGPQVVTHILRDPPGSGSYAYYSEGTTISKSSSLSTSFGEEHGFDINIKKGVKFSQGFGILTDTEVTFTAGTGMDVKNTYDTEGNSIEESTFTSTFTTNADDEYQGAWMDVYMGRSMNMNFGLSTNLTLISDEECNLGLSAVECIGNSINGYRIGRKKGFFAVPGGYGTEFYYTQHEILRGLIPELEMLRDNILAFDDRYVIHDTLNIGKNNLDVDTVIVDLNSIFDLYGTFNVSGADYASSNISSFLSNYDTNQKHLEIIDHIYNLYDDGNSNTNYNYPYNKIKKAYAEYSCFEQVPEDLITYHTNDSLKAIQNTGSNYTFTALGDTAQIDSVVWYNQQIRLWQEAIAENEKLKLEAEPASNGVSNISFDGGVGSISYEYENTKTKTKTQSWQTSISNQLLLNITAENAGNGVETQYNMDITKESSGVNSNTNTQSTTVGFVLEDGNPNDKYSIDILDDGTSSNGKVFRVQGGRTSCPYQGQELTYFYEPGTELSAATVQMEQPIISITPNSLSNVPEDELAVFNLSLGNDNPLGYSMIYDLKVVEESNPNGAIIKIDGIEANREFLVPAGASINKVLTVEKGPEALDYENIMIVFHSQCQFDPTDDNMNIADTTFLSVSFLPGCTDIEIMNPDPNWVINTDNTTDGETTMDILLSDYNYNYYSLDNIKLQYKETTSSDWVNVESYHKQAEANENIIPTDQPFIFLNWNVTELNDGEYDLRAITDCSLATEQTEIYSGHIDRLRPHNFGQPSPADGILDPNDEIKLMFNENINEPQLSPSNFKISGILNGAEIRHDAFMSFNDHEQNVNIPTGIKLNERSFTFETWLKINQNAHAWTEFFNQGDYEEGSYLRCRLKQNNIQYIVRNGGLLSAVFTSDTYITPHEWTHIAISYNHESNFVTFMVNGIVTDVFDYHLDNAYDGQLYTGEGPITVGGSNALYNLHEVRFWDEARSSEDIYANMLKSLTGTEAGLLGCWPLNELEGQPQDKARSRHGVSNATWGVSQGGYAFNFDATQEQTLHTNLSDVAFTDDQDFTIECWFKSNGNNQTLFSNGSLTTDSDNEEFIYGNYTGWTIKTNDTGNLEVHNNLSTLTSYETFADGNWHHLALIKDAKTNTSLYIDGVEQASGTSDIFNGFGGVELVLGATLEQSSSNSNYTNFLSGGIDEFRIWNKSRKLNQITRDSRSKLAGDELGLVAYYPFETYELNEFNIYEGVPTLLDQHTDTSAYKIHHLEGSAVSTDIDLPLIRLERQLEEVNFSYASNGDQIILTIEDPLSKVEGCILDVEVTEVNDLYANEMASPITWTAYINKNQLIWDDQEMSVSKIIGENLVFSTSIINQGGQVEEYAISNLPEWLTAIPSEGLLAPNSFTEIEFIVNDDLFIGKYDEDIMLTGNNEYAERLNLSVEVSAPAPEFELNSSEFEYSMNFLGKVKVDNIRSRDENDMLFAYVGEELRGVSNLIYLEEYDAYYVFLSVYSNTEAVSETQEEITFRLWDASEGKIQSQVLINGDDNIVFQSGAIIGTFEDLVVFKATNMLRQEIQLDQGWNWVSFNLDAEDESPSIIDELQFSTVFSEENIDNILILKNQYSFAQAYNNTLIGSLSSMNIKDMYQFKVTESDTIIYEGLSVNPIDNPIPIVDGWNWIGYLGQRSLAINEALNSLNPNPGDVIKSKTGFSMYASSSLGWLGTLSNLKPNEGYMIKYSDNTELIYPESSMYGGTSFRLDRNQYPVDKWLVNPSKYEHSMSIIAQIDHSDYYQPDAENILGAFVDKYCVGNITATPIVGQESLYFLTVYGNNEDILHFDYYDMIKDKTYRAENSINFEANQLCGSIENPYQIQIDVEIQDIIEDYLAIDVYPNPFADDFALSFMLEESAEVKIQLYDVLGRFVREVSGDYLESGAHKFNVGAKDLAKGAYFVEIQIGDKDYKKMIVKS